MRYDPEERRMKIKQEAIKEDKELRLRGETTEARMVRVLLPALNNINEDLNFTAEIPEDFEDRRVPTLDINPSVTQKLKKLEIGPFHLEL